MNEPKPKQQRCVDLSADRTIVDRLRRRAAEKPEQSIYHLIDEDFFEHGPSAGPSVTWRELDSQASAIAATLLDRLQPGDRVLLPFAAGLEFMPAFYGCLYAGLVPVPVYPPVRGLQADPLAAIRRICQDCRPAAAVTGGRAGAGILNLVQSDAKLQQLWWLTTESVESRRAAGWEPTEADEDALALLQYTSGSTGTPRGVAVTHENIMSNNRLIEQAFHHQTHINPRCGVCWLPFHHDMGLIGNVVHTVYADIPVYFMSPLDFVRRPVTWLQAISRLGPVTSGGPGFAYDLCVRKVTDEQKETLDLSEWSLAYIGADRVSAATIREFVDAFEPCGLRSEALYPCYGLAESTLFVTGGDWRQSPVVRSFERTSGSALPVDADTPTGQHLAGCGRQWSGLDVVIAHPDTRQRVDDQQIGEIWVGGSSVARGYWRQAEVTELTFGARLADGDPQAYLRTGDLGFFSNGELYITGRLKDVIIIRGRNYHPEDIESVVGRQHDAFSPKSTAVIGHDVGGTDRLVVLQEVDRRRPDFDPQAAKKMIRQRVAEEFELQVSDTVFLTTGALPRTSSGKLQRFACRERYESGTLQSLAWKTPVTS